MDWDALARTFRDAEEALAGRPLAEHEVWCWDHMTIELIPNETYISCFECSHVQTYLDTVEHNLGKPRFVCEACAHDL